MFFRYSGTKDAERNDLSFANSGDLMHACEFGGSQVHACENPSAFPQIETKLDCRHYPGTGDRGQETRDGDRGRETGDRGQGQETTAQGQGTGDGDNRQGQGTRDSGHRDRQRTGDKGQGTAQGTRDSGQEP